MQFTHYDLGHKKAGQIVQVTLHGNAANVRLMDSSNFQSYRNGRQHRYYGGHFTRSPARITIPSNGHWHITVDLGGYNGQVRSSISVLPGALPVYNEPSLSSVPSLVQGHNAPPGLGQDDDKDYDVFISHASEDKDEIVRPLVHALKDKGLLVWYDEFELKIGDSLRRKIDKGLANSRFGVIVLSETFLRKGWANYELDGLVTRQTTGEQVILPIWHNITKKQVIEYSPSLADKLARSTATHTVEEIASEIAEVIRNA
jgi:hypothetical protein